MGESAALYLNRMKNPAVDVIITIKHTVLETYKKIAVLHSYCLDKGLSIP